MKYVVACPAGFVQDELPQSGVRLTRKCVRAQQFESYNDAFEMCDKLKRQHHCLGIIVPIEEN